MDLLETAHKRMDSAERNISKVAQLAVETLNGLYYNTANPPGRIVEKDLSEVVPFVFATTGDAWAISFMETTVVDSETLTYRDEVDGESAAATLFRNLRDGMEYIQKALIIVMMGEALKGTKTRRQKNGT